MRSGLLPLLVAHQARWASASSVLTVVAIGPAAVAFAALALVATIARPPPATRSRPRPRPRGDARPDHPGRLLRGLRHRDPGPRRRDPARAAPDPGRQQPRDDRRGDRRRGDGDRPPDRDGAARDHGRGPRPPGTTTRTRGACPPAGSSSTRRDPARGRRGVPPARARGPRDEQHRHARGSRSADRGRAGPGRDRRRPDGDPAGPAAAPRPGPDRGPRTGPRPAARLAPRDPRRDHGGGARSSCSRPPRSGILVGRPRPSRSGEQRCLVARGRRAVPGGRPGRAVADRPRPGEAAGRHRERDRVQGPGAGRDAQPPGPVPRGRPARYRADDRGHPGRSVDPARDAQPRRPERRRPAPGRDLARRADGRRPARQAVRGGDRGLPLPGPADRDPPDVPDARDRRGVRGRLAGAAARDPSRGPARAGDGVPGCPRVGPRRDPRRGHRQRAGGHRPESRRVRPGLHAIRR